MLAVALLQLIVFTWHSRERDGKTAMTKIVAYRSQLVIVTIQVGAERYKLFQVFFGHDGSLFVTFPYFRHRHGIVAATTSPATGHNSSQIDLKIGGKIASHDVKYSHHPDGRAHFSQTGKVRTEVKRQSLPLDAYRGHIFTVHIQGVEAFKKADAFKDTESSPKRTALKFEGEKSADPHAIKFVGFWYAISALPIREPLPLTAGPDFTAITPSGEIQNGFLVASPYDDATHALFISMEKLSWVNRDQSELLLFIGGFDAPEIVNNVSREAGLLAFLYPAENADELKKALGTIDYAD